MDTLNASQSQVCRQDAVRLEGKGCPLRWISIVVATAFVLRLAVIALGHTYRITPRRDHFQFGWEMGRLARSIAEGHGFSSPTDLDSGASAWTAPVYPYILAGVFKIFGVYTRASAWMILSFNSFFAALTAWTLFRIGDRLFGRWVASTAAWTWAVFPYLIYWPVRVVWEVSFTTFLVTLALWLAMVAPDHPSRAWHWIRFGLLWGLIALTNTAVLILFPCLLAWIVRQIPGRSTRVKAILLSTLTLVVVVTPWTVRNYRTFGRFIFIRDNLPLELYEANNDVSSGFWTRSEHPGNDLGSMRRFQELGEVRFMDEKKQEFVEFVRQHPGKFLRFTVKRFCYFWAAPPQAAVVGRFELRIARHTEFLLAAIFATAGLILMFVRRNRYRWLLAPFLLIYPLPYYLVNPFPRYKHPIESVMLILIVYLLGEANTVTVGGVFPYIRHISPYQE